MKLTQLLNWRHAALALAATACFLVCLAPARAAQEERFATTNDAIKAFTSAAANKDTNALEVIFGPGVRELVSADPVQASNGLDHLSRRVSEKVEMVQETNSFIG